MSDNIRWEVMLSGSDKPHQLLPGAEEKNELPDNDMDDVVSDPNDGCPAVGMLNPTGVFVGLLMSACLLPSSGQITIALAKLWFAL